ncbi:serine/threonine-protein kinase [Streptomyces sp. NPDC002133]|uniref:serine/threonine-protein kinase n=1 Tax=Streptomyces sp. NPDC002133 TaxID=3154409 RepID=UPI00332067E3
MRNELLGGRYRLVRQLGEGGMGQVWEAQDESLGRRVAVKVISLLAGGGSLGTEARARFLREARITARLQHSNIVTIHDVGETDTGDSKVPFLVMELVRGEGLDAKLRQGVVTLRDAARWGAQICDALAEAHDAGIMHRDIKPSNILISPSGIVKVLDFGVARAGDPYASADRLTQTGFIVGTPPYMAPEQARGFPEPRSDLYALGCLLFELITRQLPFQAPDTMGYLSAHLTEEPPAPSMVSQGIPSTWDDLVLALLHKDPDQRYGNAADVAQALRQLDHAPENTPPPTMPGTTPLPRMDPTSEARRAASATITLALLCLPGLMSMVAKTVEYILDPSAPTELIAVNMAMGIAETAVLATGALMLFRQKMAGRWMITAAGGATALQCLSASVQYQLVGGPPSVEMIAYVVGPLTAASAAGAVVMAVRAPTGRWCRPAAGPGPGTTPVLPPLQPSARTATAVMALVCLLTVPVIPVATDQAVTAGAMSSDSRTVQMTLFGVQTAVLTIGLLLLLVRNTAGRWLIATGGVGLVLQAVDAMYFFDSIGYALRGVLPLAAVAAALSAILAVLSSVGRRRQQPRN